MPLSFLKRFTKDASEDQPVVFPDSSISSLVYEEPSRFSKRQKRLFAALALFLVFFVLILLPLILIMPLARNLGADFKVVRDSFSERNLITLDQGLLSAQTNLQKLDKVRTRHLGWLKYVPYARQYYFDAGAFVSVGQNSIKAGQKLSSLVEPFAAAGGFIVAETSGDADVLGDSADDVGILEAFAQWISIMPSIAPDIDPVIDFLALAGEDIRRVDVLRYPSNLFGYPLRALIEGSQQTLAQANSYAPDIKELMTVLPSILGVNTGEKRYLIMMQNNNEIRATGGFWTYYATFRINNALLSSDFTSYGTYEIDYALDEVLFREPFPSVPEAYTTYLKVPRMFARDANVSPDLPTAVENFMVYWNRAMPYLPREVRPIDGFLTIDITVLEELLKITGPVEVKGNEFTSENVSLELQRITNLALRDQGSRKQILGDLMQELLKHIFASPRDVWPEYVEKGFDLARRKHVQAWVFDEQAQPLIERFKVGGRLLNDTPSDYAFVVSTNLGGGKTNGWFVNKEVTHRLSQDDAGRFLRTVEIDFDYRDLPPAFAPFRTRYQDWVRVYVPLDSELLTIEGVDGVSGQDVELGRTFFHAYIVLDPGQKKTLRFEYYLPEDFTLENYELFVQKQSGIVSEVVRLVYDDVLQEKLIDADHVFKLP